MATLDGRELDLTVPGAVLFLTAEAQRDWVEILEDGVTVQVREGRTSAVVNGFDAASTIDDVARDARGLVNQALRLAGLRPIPEGMPAWSRWCGLRSERVLDRDRRADPVYEPHVAVGCLLAARPAGACDDGSAQCR